MNIRCYAGAIVGHSLEKIMKNTPQLIILLIGLGYQILNKNIY